MKKQHCSMWWLCEMERRWYTRGQIGAQSLGKGDNTATCQMASGQQGQEPGPANPLYPSLTPASRTGRAWGKGSLATWPKPSPPSPYEPARGELCRDLEEREPPVGALTRQFSNNNFLSEQNSRTSFKKQLSSRMETISQHPALFERTHWLQRSCFIWKVKV